MATHVDEYGNLVSIVEQKDGICLIFAHPGILVEAHPGDMVVYFDDPSIGLPLVIKTASKFKEIGA